MKGMVMGIPSRLGFLVLSVTLAGCALKRDDYAIPKVDLPKSYLHSSGEQSETDAKPGRAASMTVPQNISKWWVYFENDELNNLVETALANNHELKAAVSRINEFKALWGSVWADQWPEISSSGDYGIEAPLYKGLVKPGEKIQSKKKYEVGINISYELDLWGKSAAASEAAYQKAWSSIFARETVALTLTSSVVTSFLQYLSFNDRVQTAVKTQHTHKEMLKAVEERLENGEATALQIAQQRAAVFSAAAVIPVLELQREHALNSIALLLGKAPSEITIKSKTLNDVTFPDVQPGLPSRLLLRRPDIREAEAELISADASIDVARTQLLPTFKLTAERGFSSRNLATFLSPESLFYNAALSLTQIIFAAGKRKSQVEFAEARHGVLVQNYKKSIYTAMKEVEDALVSIRFLTLRKEAQLEAVKAAGISYELSNTTYAIGMLDYLTLLDTERTLYQDTDELHRVKLERLQASVDLFKALGGGMESQGDFVVAKAEKGKDLKNINREFKILKDPYIPVSGNSPSLTDEEGFWVQLTATWSEAAADRHWRLFKARYPKQLKEMTPTFRMEKAPIKNGNWYTMLVGPFEERNNADELCDNLRLEGQGCHILVR